MSKRKKSLTIEESGVKVHIFMRGDQFWYDLRHEPLLNPRTGKWYDRTRKSLETTILATAEKGAREMAKAIAIQELLGVTPDTLTLAQLFSAYHEHKGSKVERHQWRIAIKTRQRLFLAAWGENLPVVAISQTSVDAYSAARRKAYAAKLDRDGQPRTLRDGALDSDFRWLSSAFNWATKHRLTDGKLLLTRNPLHDCKWPREKRDNLRRPVPNDDRYRKTLEQAEAVDPMGRFRVALTLAHETGHRINAILNLKASDILLSTERIRGALAAASKDESDAVHIKHGAIRWRAEFDKMRVLRISPISADARTALENYLAANPRVGEVPLLPAVENADRPLGRHTANKWMGRAERLAELPKVRGGLWHGYRRLFATSRKHLPPSDVAEVGGWSGTKAMLDAYTGSTPAGRLAVVS